MTVPLKTVTPIKPVTTVKPAQPVGVPATVTVTVPLVKADVPNANNNVYPAEALKQSVTEISKEERLADVKNAVQQVAGSIQSVAPKEKDMENKDVSKKTTSSPKNSQKGKRPKTASEIEANKEPIIRQELPDDTSRISLQDYLKKEDEFRAFLQTIPGNALIVDIPSDELKSLEILWEEGKTCNDPKYGEYVLALDIWENGMYKIFVKDIIHVTVNTYYDDVRLANPMKLGEYYHVHHRGRRVFDKISAKAFDYLAGKNLIPKINYCTIDAHTRLRFFGKQIADITDADYQHEKDMKIPISMRSKMTSQAFFDESKEEGVTT